MKLRDGARIAVIGAGPSGLAAAKEALEAGFDATLFEASDDLGGQWYTTAPHSGVWPGMRTNTSRAMTAFSDFPAPPSHPLHPAAEQIHDYLRAYAEHFGLVERIRFRTALWAGEVAAPGEAAMRAAIAAPPAPLEVHNAFATALAEELGVAPDPIAWPDLTEPLLFGPLLPPRYRLEGPGARADAVDLFEAQLAASPRAPVGRDDVEALRGFGLGAAAAMLLATRLAAPHGYSAT